MSKNNGLTLQKVLFHLLNGRSCDQKAKVIRLSQEFHGKKQFSYKKLTHTASRLKDCFNSIFFIKFIKMMANISMA